MVGQATHRSAGGRGHRGAGRDRDFRATGQLQEVRHVAGAPTPRIGGGGNANHLGSGPTQGHGKRTGVVRITGKVGVHVEQHLQAGQYRPRACVEETKLDRVVVTGGSGKAGRAVTRELVDSGYDILNVDLVPTPDAVAPFLAADLTKLGEVFECLHGADAVVHLAAIPAPGLRTEAETFEINTMSTYHVFSAACSLGLSRVVWASSETVLGLPFEREQPDYLPVDEGQTPLPQSSYSLSKLLGESMAAQCSRRFGVPFVGLRFSNIMEQDDYRQFPVSGMTPTCGSGTCGLCRCPGRCRRDAARSGSRDIGSGDIHRGGRRHRHEPSQCRTRPNGLPRCPGAAPTRWI